MTDDLLETGERNPFSALRRIAHQTAMRTEAPKGGKRRAEEQCDLCGESIGPEHRHLLDLATQQPLCVCRACTLLFDKPAAGAGARLLIPTRCLRLMGFDLTDAEWASLQVPVNIAYFCHTTAAKRMAAFYPSPMGPTGATVPSEAWEALANRHPTLRQMEPDVEALLVNWRRGGGDSYLVPIDECYLLVGLIRLHWKGLSGGTEVRQEIERFFERLNERAVLVGGVHA